MEGSQEKTLEVARIPLLQPATFRPSSIQPRLGPLIVSSCGPYPQLIENFPNPRTPSNAKPYVSYLPNLLDLLSPSRREVVG